MQDYSLTKKDQKNFVISYKKEKDGTYSVVFADGSVFKHIEANEENIEKIEGLLESQIKDGKKRYNLLRKRAKCSMGVMLATPVAIATASTLVTNIPAFDSVMSTYNPIGLVCGIGLITVVGSIPAYCKMKKNMDTVLEIDKIKYVEAHRATLDTFREHPNALVGINERTQTFIRSKRDPFNVDNLQRISLSDLRTIVENIDKEECLGFTYKKVPNKVTKKTEKK